MSVVHSEYLKTDGTEWKAESLTQDTDYYSDPIKMLFAKGFTALLVLLTGGSDDVDITFEVSLNKSDWYAPTDTYGTALNEIYTTLTSSAWIVFDAKPAGWIRFKFAPDATSTVTATYIQEEL